MKKKTILLLMILTVLIIAPNVKAYELYSGTQTPTLARWVGANGTGNLDTGFNGDTTSVSYGLDSFNKALIYFNATTYFGYTNYFYQFSGNISTYGGPNIIINNAYIINNSNWKIIGTCDFNTFGTGQMQSWSSTCWIPQGLSNGTHANVLVLEIASGTPTPQEGYNFDFNFTSMYTLYSNYYINENNNNDITNSINNQTQQQEENHEEIMNSDVTDETKESADTSNATEMEETQQDIYNTLFETAPNPMDVLNITIDTESNSWLWNTMQTLINTNTRIITFIVTILSIGLAKMILGR